MRLGAQLPGERRLRGRTSFSRAGLGAGLRDLGLDQRLEPRPRDPAVGGLGDRGGDVGRFVLARLRVLLDHEPRVGRPHLAGSTRAHSSGRGGPGPGRRPSAAPRRRSSARSGPPARPPRTRSPPASRPRRTSAPSPGPAGGLVGVQPVGAVDHRPLVGARSSSASASRIGLGARRRRRRGPRPHPSPPASSRTWIKSSTDHRQSDLA